MHTASWANTHSVDCDFGLHYRCLPDVKRQCSQDDVKPLKSPSTSRSTFFNTVRGKNTLNINTEPIADSETASVSTDNVAISPFTHTHTQKKKKRKRDALTQLE